MGLAVLALLSDAHARRVPKAAGFRVSRAGTANAAVAAIGGATPAVGMALVLLAAEQAALRMPFVPTLHNLANGIAAPLLAGLAASALADAAVIAAAAAATRLPNRAALQRALDTAVEGPDGCALLFCDLDAFKRVDDTLGHDAGDRVLQAVAERVTARLGPGDLPARQGGDEFLVLATGVRSDAAATPAERRADAMDEPVAIDGQAVPLGIAVGWASAPEDAVDAGGLLRAADAAMYAVKRRDRARRRARVTLVRFPPERHHPARRAAKMQRHAHDPQRARVGPDRARVSVPLDHGRPDGERITVFAREAAAVDGHDRRCRSSCRAGRLRGAAAGAASGRFRVARPGADGLPRPAARPDEFEPDGLRTDGDRILGRLLHLTRGRA